MCSVPPTPTEEELNVAVVDEDNWWQRLSSLPRDQGLLNHDAPVRSAPPHKLQNWLDATFKSPAARSVQGRGRPTQRFAFGSDACGAVIHCEGGNELTAALVLEQFWRIGIVRRYKMQPFQLAEFGYPTDAVPDILVELCDDRVFSIEVKAAKYFTAERKLKFDAEREFLRQHALPHLLWTDTKELSRRVWHASRHLQRGFAFDVEASTKLELSQSLSTARTLGDLMLLPACSWDQLMAAASRGYFHLDLKEKFHEKARIHSTGARTVYGDFLVDRDEPSNWFDTLADCEAGEWESLAA